MTLSTAKDRERRLEPEPPKPGDGETGRHEFERDRARIIHSGSFRRLQGKTQVVAPREADFFRTRLTHTLECAQIGAALARRVGADPTLVEAACMAHDLGHPPFGHNGEVALGCVMKDYGGFEGNAQSLRAVAKLETKFSPPEGPERYGLNLTRGVLNSMLKYPWRRDESPPREFGSRYKGTKYNFYDDDSASFRFAREGFPSKSQRFEAALMDWADDVAYSVHDLEDGIRAALIPMNTLKRSSEERHRVARFARDELLKKPSVASVSIEQLEELLTEFLNADYFDWAASPYRRTEQYKAGVKGMSSGLIGHFIAAVPKRDDFDPTDPNIGVREESVLQSRLLMAITFVYVIRRRELATLQRGQRYLIGKLFQVFREEGKTLLPNPENETFEEGNDAQKARCVCDHIAGMTDRYAERIYNRLFSSGRGSVTDVI